jgi:outer membrane protein OmpA-like peptidoglycan-associated protein
MPRYQHRLVVIMALCLFMAFVQCSIIGPIVNQKINESKLAKQKGKQPEKLTQDVTPPPDYKPNFLSNTKTLAASPQPNSVTTPPSSRIDVQLSRIETTDPNQIYLYLHFIDQDGNYISGAAAKEFKKYWCGVEESWDTLTYPIEDFTVTEETERDSIPLAMCVVMDHSGSIGDDRAIIIQNVVADFINQKRIEDALALVKFDDHIGLESPLTTDTPLIRSRFQKNGLAGYGGFTAMLDAIDRAIDELAKSKDYNKRKHIIIFTDGYENASSTTMETVISKAVNANINIHTIGFGAYIDVPFLQELAARTGGMYRQMYMTSEFGYVFADSYFRQKNFYQLTYKPKNYGLLTITVKVCLPEGDKIVTAQAYYPPPQKNIPALINILFEFDKYEIPKKYEAEIAKVHNLMTQIYPKCKIEIHGHTCNMGEDDYNQILSENRANAVKKALTNRGIAADRINVIGFGESKPVASNDTEEGRKINRRIEFIITSTGE